MSLHQALKAMRPDCFLKMMVGDKVFHITVKMAVAITRTAGYEGEFRHGRVFKMREIADTRVIVHDHRFRDGRACLQFVPVTKKTVDLWEHIFSKSYSVQVP